MSKTPNLGVAYVAPAQAQKHVTVNEAFAQFDSLVQCTVREMHRNDPPGGAAEGDRYIVGAAPTGGWSGQARRLAVRRNGGWAFETPRPGWRAFNLADDRLHVLTSGGAWSSLGGEDSGGGTGGGGTDVIQNASLLGLGTTAEPGAPFAARLNAALWTARTQAEGGSGDLHVVLNKSAAAREAGLLFQTGFVTRALLGLFGSNNTRLSVSTDGNSFRDALVIDGATGTVDQPSLPRFKAYANVNVAGPAETWVKIAINVAEYNDQGGFDAATSRFTAPVAGTYLLGASLIYVVGAGNAARMRGRLVLNGGTEIRGSFGEISGNHVTQATALWLQTMAPLNAGDTVELQGQYRAADGFFGANHTTFWGCKVG